jgi:hypothetical protein
MPDGGRKSQETWRRLRPHQTSVEVIDVSLQLPLISNDPRVTDEARNRTLSSPTIGESVEEGRVRIPLDEPIGPTTLPPVLFLHPGEVKKLTFKMITQRPAIVIQARMVRDPIKIPDLRQDVSFEVPFLLPKVGPPTSEKLPKASGNTMPSLDRVLTPRRLTRQVLPTMGNQRMEIWFL